MILRVFLLAVLVGQALVSLAAPVPALAPAGAETPECHQQMDRVADQPAPAEAQSSHCEGQCCCPGLCAAALLLSGPIDWVSHHLPTINATGSRSTQPDHTARLYRPPILT